MKKIIYLILWVGTPMCGFSQNPAQQVITGTVLSEADGTPLPGATVKLAGSSRGTNTNENGQFTLPVTREKFVLLVSFLGYQPLDTSLQVPLDGPLFISLRRDAAMLDEVVVSTGYQTLPKERATGSFAKPYEKLYDNRVSTDIISKLDGIVSGLIINRGDLGGAESPLKIRGQSTIYANDAALIVVDNFPYSGDINNINPNDISSVSILKDAAAASIWGAFSGNGVIVVTTKQGKTNQPLKIQFNSNITISEKPNLFYDPGFLSSNDFITVEQNLFQKGFYDERLEDPAHPVVSPVIELLIKKRNGILTEEKVNSQMDAFRGIDVRNQLRKYFYRNSINQQYSLGIQGGGHKNSYYFSGGYDKNLRPEIGNEYERIKLTSFHTFKPIKEVEVAAGIYYTQSKSETDNILSELKTGGGYSTLYPYAQIADEQGRPLAISRDFNTTFIQTAEENGFLNWQFIPLSERRLNTTLSKNVNTRLTAGIKYYTFLKGLSAEVKYQYEKGNMPSQIWIQQQSYLQRNKINQFSEVVNGEVTGHNMPLGGELIINNGSMNAANIRGQLNYFNISGKHFITAIAGVEQREISSEANNVVLYGYDDATATSEPIDLLGYYEQYPLGSLGKLGAYPTISGGLTRFRSYFANASYTYYDKYTFSVSGRNDGSNYFGVKVNQKSIPLWSAGFKWDIDKESFFKIPSISYLRLRTTYGFNGNLNKNLAAITTFRYTVNSFLNGNPVTILDNIPNPELKWEKTGMLNIGLDFGVWSEKLTGSIEYFRKKGIDLIGDAVMDPTTGIKEMRGNFANMKGEGVDLQLNTKFGIKPFSWSSSFLFSYATNEITHYEIEPQAYSTVSGGINPIVGKPVYGMYSYRSGGLDPQTGDPRGYLNNEISKDYGSILSTLEFDDIKFQGSARPVIYGGWSNIFSYREFTVFANISYKLGYYFRRSSIRYGALFESWIGHEDFAKRWQVPGDERVTDIPSMTYPANQSRDNFFTGSEVLVARGDHVRLQDIGLSYSFERSSFKKLPFSNLEIYIYANNLGILWRSNNLRIDPDYPLGGIPPAKSLAIGIKAEF